MESNNIVPGSHETDPIPVQYYSIPKDPIEPRAFIVNRDGTAVELMTNSEVNHIKREAQRNPEMTVLGVETIEDAREGEIAPRTYRLQQEIRKRKVFTDDIEIPNIIRGGAGCSTVVEVDDHRGDHGSFVIARTLIEYAPLTDEETMSDDMMKRDHYITDICDRQALKDLTHWSHQCAHDADNDQLYTAPFDTRSPYEIEEQRDLQREIVEKRQEEKGSVVDPVAKQVAKPIEARPSLMSRSRSKRLTVDDGIGGYFRDPDSTRRFTIQQAVQRIMTRSFRGERRMTQSSLSVNDQLPVIESLKEFMMSVSRVLEPNGDIAEFRSIDLSSSPYMELIMACPRLKTGIPRLFEACGLTHSSSNESIFDITIELSAARLAFDIISEELDRLKKLCLSGDITESAVGPPSDMTSIVEGPRPSPPPQPLPNRPVIVARSPSPQSFTAREAIARRRLRTSATIKASGCHGELSRTLIGDASNLVAFALIKIEPGEAIFGTLIRGNTYRLGLRISNIGLETGRFSIDAVIDDDMRVIRTPGPLAPGMNARVEIELYAKASGSIIKEVCIRSELENYRVPLMANIVGDGPAELGRNVRLVCRGRRSDGVKAVNRSSIGEALNVMEH